MRQTIIATVLLLLASSCSTYRKYSRPEEIGTTGLFGDSISYTDTATIASVHGVVFSVIPICSL